MVAEGPRSSAAQRRSARAVRQRPLGREARQALASARGGREDAAADRRKLRLARPGDRPAESRITAKGPRKDGRYGRGRDQENDADGGGRRLPPRGARGPGPAIRRL